MARGGGGGLRCGGPYFITGGSAIELIDACHQQHSGSQGRHPTARREAWPMMPSEAGMVPLRLSSSHRINSWKASVRDAPDPQSSHMRCSWSTAGSHLQGRFRRTPVGKWRPVGPPCRPWGAAPCGGSLTRSTRRCAAGSRPRRSVAPACGRLHATRCSTDSRSLDTSSGQTVKSGAGGDVSVGSRRVMDSHQ